MTPDFDLAPVAILLFVISLARVIHAFWYGERFDAEPTLALAFVVGVPYWLGRQIRRKVNADCVVERPGKLHRLVP